MSIKKRQVSTLTYCVLFYSEFVMKWFLQLNNHGNIDAENALRVRVVHIKFMRKPCGMKSKT